MKLPVPILFVSAIVFSIAGCGSGGGGAGGLNNGAGQGDNALPLQKKNISGSTTDSSKPLISSNSNGVVYIAWEEATGSNTREIYLKDSRNSGDDFTLTKGASRTFCGSNPDVSEDFSLKAAYDGSLFFAWIDKWPGDTRVMFYSDPTLCKVISSVSAGTAYSPGFTLGGTGGMNDIGMTWSGTDSGNGEIYYSHSENKGVTFSSPLNISETPASDSTEPLLAVEGSFNYPKAVWVEGDAGNRKVVSSQFLDATGDFVIFEPVSEGSIDSACPAVSSSAGGTYIAYKGDNSIQLSAWSPILLSFAEPDNLSPGSVSPSCPAIATNSDGTVYVAWSDNNKIRFAVSENWGISFSSPKDIASDASSSSPRMAAFGSVVGIVWEGNNGSNKDIYLSVSADNGKTFSNQKNLSNTPSPSSSPVIDTDSSKFIYVAWEEGQEGSRDIYFIKYAPAK